MKKDAVRKLATEVVELLNEYGTAGSEEYAKIFTAVDAVDAVQLNIITGWLREMHSALVSLKGVIVQVPAEVWTRYRTWGLRNWETAERAKHEKAVKRAWKNRPGAVR